MGVRGHRRNDGVSFVVLTGAEQMTDVDGPRFVDARACECAVEFRRREREPASGHVDVDAVEVETAPPHDWRSRIGEDECHVDDARGTLESDAAVAIGDNVAARVDRTGLERE
jgi:hypothetical protein